MGPLISTLKSDLLRLETPTVRNAVKWYFLPKGECFPYVVWLRILQSVRRMRLIKWILGLPVYFIYRHYEFKYGIHANANIDIGGGFRPVHGPCNLNAAKIGKNFTVYSGVTVGICKGGVPTIGDDVSIYPNAVICGGISIGDRATIGALTYVSRNVGSEEMVHG